MCVLKNPQTGEPLIDYDADPPTCCPDCEQDWEYQKNKESKLNYQANLMYAMQINQLTGIINFNNSNQNSIMNHVQKLENMVISLKSQLEPKSIPKALFLNTDDKKDRLINFLFKSQTFAYSMVLSQEFETQLYKQKNFNIGLKLVDSNNNFIRNCNPIPICLKIYTSNTDNPQPLQTNKSGLALIKGNTQTQLYHGLAQFNKLHLRQVTSYFENGWVYLVIFAKSPSFNYTSSKSEFDLEVAYSDIKPLVVSQVCVKAKPKRKL